MCVKFYVVMKLGFLYKRTYIEGVSNQNAENIRIIDGLVDKDNKGYSKYSD